MTASWADGECSVAVHQPQHQQRKQKKKAAEAAQVVAVLFAVRVGYKLARSAGKLLFETRLGCCRPESAGDAAEELEVVGGDDGESAEDQWVLCSEPVPQPPEGAKLMASEHLPISVYHFYEQFLSVETTCMQDHHRSTGQYSFRASRWKTVPGGAAERLLDFMQPKRGVCSANAHCVQQQRFSVHAGGVFVLTSDMAMAGIPYADCFRVQGFWRADPDATGLGCNVSIHVAVPFSKRCLVRGLIMRTTLQDCQSFYQDFLSKVQNSIATELLPAAAAQAVAAEQLLGASPTATTPAGAGRLRAPPQLRSPSPRGPGGVTSPFAAVDAEVFVSTPMQAGGSAPQRRRSSKLHKGQQQERQQQKRRGWFQWLHDHHHEQQQQEHTAGAGGGVQGQHPQQHAPPPLQQQQQQLGHHRSSSRCPTPGGGRHMSRAVSVKPSFALPIADLHLPNRPQPAELLSTAQAILLLLLLLVQVITLYDNLAIRRLLSAGAAGGGPAAV